MSDDENEEEHIHVPMPMGFVGFGMTPEQRAEILKNQQIASDVWQEELHSLLNGVSKEQLRTIHKLFRSCAIDDGDDTLYMTLGRVQAYLTIKHNFNPATDTDMGEMKMLHLGLSDLDMEGPEPDVD